MKRYWRRTKFFELSSSNEAILEKNEVLRRIWDRVLDHMESGDQNKKV
jgi:hypothetical protein